MSRRSTAGLSIRSDYAQARAEELARRTGLTTTEIVEAALRAYEPGEPPGEPTITMVVDDLPLYAGPHIPATEADWREAEADVRSLALDRVLDPR